MAGALNCKLQLFNSLPPRRKTHQRARANMSMESPSFAYLFTGKRPIGEPGRNTKWVLNSQVKPHIYPNKSRNPSTLCLAAGNGGFSQTDRIRDRDGVVIVDHGSRRKESNFMLDEFVAMFRDKTGYLIVEPAHMAPNLKGGCNNNQGGHFRGAMPEASEKSKLPLINWSPELAEPSIRDAFGLCVKQGAKRVIVSPFFLFPGRHWHQDIPSLTAEAAKEHPGVSYIITAPLGLHELLVDVVNDRIKHCLDHVAGDVDECSVCAGTSKCRLY